MQNQEKSNALYNLFLRDQRWTDTRPIRTAWNDGYKMGLENSDSQTLIVNLENTLRDLDRKMLADGIDSSKAYWHETIMGLLFPREKSDGGV